MDGLILLVILLPIIFLFLLISTHTRAGLQNRRLESLDNKISELTTEIANLANELRNQRGKEPPRQEPEVMTRPEPVIIRPPLIRHEPLPPVAVVVDQPIPASTTPPEKKVEPVTVEAEDRSYSPFQFDKKKDLEKFIGENIANKIGIAVLVLGIGFFIKYAIDKNYIGASSRVITGLICGSILIAFAHRLRNKYRSFSSVLVGGGLTVYYFSIAFAFHEYHLIGQTTAFIAMVFVAGIGVLLSLFYNRQELAILATIGGFITPFLVSTGQENHIALFTYISILNTGLMVLAWFKKWPAINVIALIFTLIIYGGWLISKTLFDDPELLPLKDALLFATIFYLLFVAMNIINSIRLRNRFTAFDFILVLSTNFLYYIAGFVILDFWGDGKYQGLFTGLIGVFNLVLALVLYRKKSVDRNFVALLTGVAISFISLVAPIEFRGNHITLFWATEMVLLLFLYLRTKYQLLYSSSLIVVILMLVSLVNSWATVYLQNEAILPIIFNKGFITTIVAGLSLFIYYFLSKKIEPDSEAKPLDTNALKKIIFFLAILITYLSGLWETWFQFDSRFELEGLSSIYIQAYTFAFCILVLALFRKESLFPILKFILTSFCFALYLFLLGNNGTISQTLVEQNKHGLFIIHWLADILLLWLLYDLIVSFFKRKTGAWSEYSVAFTWLSAAAIILLLSIEMYQVILWSQFRKGEDWYWWENLYFKAGLTILWGICSFIMMWLGMRKNYRPLRIISLTLFTITLIKLFTYDIQKIPPGGKIAAFILLGILLLAVSFMYQRLKKIIIDNTTE